MNVVPTYFSLVWKHVIREFIGIFYSLLFIYLFIFRMAFWSKNQQTVIIYFSVFHTHAH